MPWGSSWGKYGLDDDTEYYIFSTASWYKGTSLNADHDDDSIFSNIQVHFSNRWMLDRYIKPN